MRLRLSKIGGTTLRHGAKETGSPAGSGKLQVGGKAPNSPMFGKQRRAGDQGLCDKISFTPPK